MRRSVYGSFLSGRRRYRQIAARFAQRKIGLIEWREAMRREIRRQYFTATLASHGGWAMMEREDWLEVARHLKREYRYLDSFTQQIARLPESARGRYLESRGFAHRAQTYTNNARNFFENERIRLAINSKYEFEGRRCGHSNEKCEGCTGEIMRTEEWVPVADLAQIGDFECRHYCLCQILLRPRMVKD